MKNIILKPIIFCALFSLISCFENTFSANAQIAFRGGSLYADEVQLTKENAAKYLPESIAQEYSSALTIKKIGSSLLFVSGGILVASGLTWGATQFYMNTKKTDLLPAGYAIAGVGAVTGAALGISALVTYLVGRNQIRLIAQKSAGATQAGLEFGFTPSGVVLALHF